MTSTLLFMNEALFRSVDWFYLWMSRKKTLFIAFISYPETKKKKNRGSKNKKENIFSNIFYFENIFQIFKSLSILSQHTNQIQRTILREQKSIISNA
jgi:hypothetical protein